MIRLNVQELDKNPEGKLLTCMDMKGTKLSMFAGEVKVRRTYTPGRRFDLAGFLKVPPL